MEFSFTIHYTTSAENGKVNLKSDCIGIDDKKDGCVSFDTQPSNWKGFLRQVTIQIAHRWEVHVRRGTLCCVYNVGINPVPVPTQPRVSLH